MRTYFYFLLAIAFASCAQHTETEHEDHSEAYDALRFLGDQAAYPNQDIPADGYGRAWDVLQQNFVSNQRGGAGAWESLGPNNVGGRTLCIAIHPIDTSIIYLGSASGGLWRSTTGGYGLNAWQPVETGHDVHGVACIAFNPSDPEEIWIGTGETYDYGTSLNGLVVRTTRGSHGIGILRTTNGGANWAKVLDWSYQNQRTVWDIAFNPTNTNIVYAATTEGVLKTTNAGTWSTVLDKKMVMDLAMDPQNPNVIYAGVGNLTSDDKGLYQTLDAGATWQRLTNGLPAFNTGRTTVSIFPANPNIVFAHVCDHFSSQGLYKSINKGASWALITYANLASYQGWYSKCLHVRSNDANRIWSGGTYLWSTTDATNFQQETTYAPSAIEDEPWPDMHDLIENPKDPNKLYLLTDAGLYRSNNDGQTWQWAAHGYNVSQFYTGSVSAQNPEFIIGGLQDRNSQLHIGQGNWQAIGGGDGTFNAIDPTDDQRYYIASQYLNMYGSQGGFLQGSPDVAFVAPFILAPSNPSVLYAGDSRLLKSTDYASSFQESDVVDNDNPILSMDASRQNSEKVYFATAPKGTPPMKVFMTTNGGNTFTNISSGLPDRYPRDIAIDPQNDQTAYIAFSGFGTPHLYKTINNGQSWVAIGTGLPDIPFHTVLVHPLYPNLVWAGSDLGVFESPDSGQTWQWLGQGIPSAVFVFELEYSPADNSLLAFTHGRGVYRLPLGNSSNTSQITDNQVLVYPTVVTEPVTISLAQPLTEAAEIILIERSGKVVLRSSIETGNELTVLNLPPYLLPGVYFLQIRTKKGVVVKKLVKS
jgi:photosystem II stability/assembly factor-like uncharacterized protein